jgi:hypothetical protein
MLFFAAAVATAAVIAARCIGLGALNPPLLPAGAFVAK